MIYIIISILCLGICFILYACCKIAAKADEEIESINRRGAE